MFYRSITKLCHTELLSNHVYNYVHSSKNNYKKITLSMGGDKNLIKLISCKSKFSLSFLCSTLLIYFGGWACLGSSWCFVVNGSCSLGGWWCLLGF